MGLHLKFVRESKSGLARLYENSAGSRLWVPRSVCKSTIKFTATEHEVDIAEWWLDKNPWPPNRQNELKI